MSTMAQRGSQRNLAQTWGNRVGPCRDTYLLHPCDLCSHHTTMFSFPAAGGQVLPSTSSHLPSCQLLPWQESHTTERVCNTVRYFSHLLSAEESTGGFSKGGQICVNSKQRHILLYSATYCTLSGSALWLCPLSEPSFGWQVFDEGDLISS